jgi:tripartite-type tricarboxylate transporter receptor subunit TctC
MNLRRRQFLHLAACAAALPAASRIARAQTYPARPVRIIVPYAAAGATDLYARLIGQVLGERLGQQFIIENRPGAASNIATEAVVRAAPDGYTLLMATPANAVNAALYDKLNFNFIRDVAPVARIAYTPLVVVVHPTVPSGPFRSSSPTPRPIRASSIWPRVASGAHPTLPASCSRS